MTQQSENNSRYTGSEIAIIGMAGRFPGARNLDEFWQNLKDGAETITVYTDQQLLAAGIDPAVLRQPTYVKALGALQDIEYFDAPFFGIAPREAEILDPQHRLFLESAWEALEHAGYDPKRYPGSIGVFAGAGKSAYFITNLYPNQDLVELVGFYKLSHANDKDYLATRTSYELDLRGPSVSVQTACSTSMVAVHMACQSLLSGESDMVLAGGVSIRTPQVTGYFHQEGGILSPDGHCRAFDAEAAGTIVANGVGIVVLKRLDDALRDGDTIHGVILGTAINNDGASKVGYQAPSVTGQAAVITEAQAVAGVEPETITYVEAHGTGTLVGDPIEIAALTKAFRRGTEKTGYCAIGSLKSNVGHLDIAAGIGGLIKTTLALKHRQIPSTLHVNKPNPKIDWSSSPFRVNTHLTEWKVDSNTRRAGVSSFGIGGTNAHAVLEEAPEPEASGPSRSKQLLVLSARTQAALEKATDNLAAYLKAHPEVNMADAAYTLKLGRKAFGYRRVLVSGDRDEAAELLESRHPERVFTGGADQQGEPAVVFMFPGQGAQYVEMAAELYRSEPVFRDEVDRCCQVLHSHLGFDLRTLLYPAESEAEHAAKRLSETGNTQPALFVIEYALAKLLMAWGIQPQAMIGHSVGEYVAACLAGVFSLDDALVLVAARGRLIQGLPGGSMLAVPLPEHEVRAYLSQDISLAAVNGPSACVLAGDHAAIDALQARLSEGGVSCRRLHTSHAFHSHMLDQVLDAFGDQLSRIRLNLPAIPYISNVTGTWISPEQATDRGYWISHLRQTVRFSAGITELVREAGRVLLEVGPGRTLSTLARQTDRSGARAILPTMRHPSDHASDLEVLLGALGRLWVSGVAIDWEAFYAMERRGRVPLPTYPFERRRYWVEAPAGIPRAQTADTRELPLILETPAVSVLTAGSEPAATADGEEPAGELEQAIAEIWRKFLGVDSLSVHDNFFDLGGDSLLAINVVPRLQQAGIQVSVQQFFDYPTVRGLAEAVEGFRPSLQVPPGAAGTVADQLAPESRSDTSVAASPAYTRPVADHIFLTGATGFIGTHVLHELLDRTDSMLHCLIRAGSEAEGQSRIMDRLAWYFPQEDISRFADRIRVVPGDLSSPQLGIAQEAYNAICRDVGLIIHAAADVRHFGDRQHFARVNVQGTREVVTMARSGRQKGLHHLSTLGVAGRPNGDRRFSELDLEVNQDLENAPYAWSKFHAEKAIQEAASHGLSAAVYRTGFVVGDSRTGRFQPNIGDNVLYRLLRITVLTGLAPDAAQEHLEFIPVDFLARSLVGLASTGKVYGQTFHITNPRPLAYPDLISTLKSYGYGIELVPASDYVQRLLARSDQRGMEAEIGELPSFGGPRWLIESQITQGWLRHLGLDCPAPTQEWLRSTIRYCIDVGFLPPPPNGN